MSPPAGDALRVANCSGFYGDRPSAALEMVEGGPIDVLTGDWLAELTMLILAKDRMKDPGGGYARTFPRQMEHVMGTCLDRGIKVVANAGGLNPAGCAAAVQRVADDLGLQPTIAYVAGDDLLARVPALAADGRLANLDTGEPFGDRTPMTANAYLGCWGIVEALARGADIVVTGRTTDASVVMGPAAWHHGWSRTDWDRLAGACVAGHVVECGTQCTGGNYAFFQEIPGLERPGFPLAEIAADGSSVITKHPGTGGLVNIGTVTAQLLYEIGAPGYLNPDVVARFDTIELADDGPDRVRISGVRGEPAPGSLKVCINYVGGYRASATFALTGLDIEEKAELAERTFFANLPVAREDLASVTTTLVRSDHADPATNEEAVAELTITAKDPDPAKLGRAFRNTAIEMALASYPGFFSRDMTSDAKPYGVYWPAVVPGDTCASEVVIGGQVVTVDNTPGGLDGAPVDPTAGIDAAVPGGPTVAVPLGRLAGARSGDKGGNANVGLWVRTPEAYAWLAHHLTVERLAELFPEARAHTVERFELPNLLAINLVFRGILEEGVASSTRMDAQAKGLGEYLRARIVDVPESLLGGAS